MEWDILKKALPYSPSNTREVCVCSLVSTDMADKDDVSAAPYRPVVSTNGLVGCQAEVGGEREPAGTHSRKLRLEWSDLWFPAVWKR